MTTAINCDLREVTDRRRRHEWSAVCRQKSMRGLSGQTRMFFVPGRSGPLAKISDRISVCLSPPSRHSDLRLSGRDDGTTCAPLPPAWLVVCSFVPAKEGVRLRKSPGHLIHYLRQVVDCRTDSALCGGLRAWRCPVLITISVVTANRDGLRHCQASTTIKYAGFRAPSPYINHGNKGRRKSRPCAVLVVFGRAEVPLAR